MMQMRFNHVRELAENRTGKLWGNQILRDLHVRSIGSDKRHDQADEFIVLQQRLWTLEEQGHQVMQADQNLLVLIVTLQSLQLTEALDADQRYRVTPQGHQH